MQNDHALQTSVSVYETKDQKSSEIHAEAADHLFDSAEDLFLHNRVLCYTLICNWRITQEAEGGGFENR